MNKCLVLFVEGDTEVEFYRCLISYAREKRIDGKFGFNIECKNVKGIGGFKNTALRKFIKEIRPKYGKNCKFFVALCRDTDVFELAPKPPIDWKEVEKTFKANGVQNIIHIKAKRSIEDWFLFDVETIISFLHLPKSTKVSGKNGYDKIKKLFKQANKMYYKGIRSNGMVEKLDIDKIVQNIYPEIEPLFKLLEI